MDVAMAANCLPLLRLPGNSSSFFLNCTYETINKDPPIANNNDTNIVPSKFPTPILLLEKFFSKSKNFSKSKKNFYK